MHHDLILKGLKSIDLDKINTRSDAQKIAIHIEEVGVQQFLLKNLYWIEEKGQLAWRMNLNVIEKNIHEILK